MKFTTTLVIAGAILVAMVSAVPTPQFGGSIGERQWGGEVAAGDKRAPQFGGEVEKGKKYDHDGALYTPSGPAKPVVERQFGGDSLHDRQWGGSSSDKRQFGGDSSQDRQWGSSTSEKRQFGGSSTGKRPLSSSSTDKHQFDSSSTGKHQFGGSSPDRQQGGSSS
ncbi:hypothetical protein P171DRAFT_487451 [Karstenula rhodostoma CBS 690.94]|uniref:Secreted protein n=1 Tax=Karstenula rhodostoma CBS 690.94 TaxID=1392251 RepID=A0A9P4PBY6_9PLEO|nr:hypothetical protein P171DRAFT_487451 [Karstenula rhodostoma CBS 690.94]